MDFFPSQFLKMWQHIDLWHHSLQGRFKHVKGVLHNGASGIIPEGPSKTRVKNRIIASGSDCAKAVAKKARLAKLRVYIMQDIRGRKE